MVAILPAQHDELSCGLQEALRYNGEIGHFMSLNKIVLYTSQITKHQLRHLPNIPRLSPSCDPTHRSSTNVIALLFLEFSQHRR